MARPPVDKNRRQKLIEIAIKIMAKDGYSQMSFQKIADMAKVSQSTVMHYFPTKNELLTEVSDYVAQNNRAFTENFELITDAADERLLKYVLNNFKWAESNPDKAQVIVLLSFLAINNEEFKVIYKKRLQAVREKIVGILYAGLRESKFHFDIKQAENLAAMVHNFVVGTITNYLASGESGEKRNVLGKLELFLSGLLGSPVKMTNRKTTNLSRDLHK